MSLSANHRAAITAAVDAITEAVAAAGDRGAPGGVLYAALMDKITLAQFQALMACAVAVGKVEKRGELYFAVRERPTVGARASYLATLATGPGYGDGGDGGE